LPPLESIEVKLLALRGGACREGNVHLYPLPGGKEFAIKSGTCNPLAGHGRQSDPKHCLLRTPALKTPDESVTQSLDLQDYYRGSSFLELDRQRSCYRIVPKLALSILILVDRQKNVKNFAELP